MSKQTRSFIYWTRELGQVLERVLLGLALLEREVVDLLGLDVLGVRVEVQTAVALHREVQGTPRETATVVVRQVAEVVANGARVADQESVGDVLANLDLLDREVRNQRRRRVRAGGHRKHHGRHQGVLGEADLQLVD